MVWIGLSEYNLFVDENKAVWNSYCRQERHKMAGSCYKVRKIVMQNLDKKKLSRLSESKVE